MGFESRTEVGLPPALQVMGSRGGPWAGEGSSRVPEEPPPGLESLGLSSPACPPAADGAGEPGSSSRDLLSKRAQEA